MSPPSIGRVSEIPVLPPAFLGNDKALIAEQNIVARVANALYAHYDELRFNSFSWAYWHATRAPVHMAAGHFGAAIRSSSKCVYEGAPELSSIKPLSPTKLSGRLSKKHS